MMMRSVKTHLTLFVLLLAALGLPGCGGSDEEPPTKAEFIASSEALCKKQNERLEQEVEKYSDERNLRYRKPPPKVFEEEAEEILVPAIERKLDGLRQLGAPAGEEQRLERILGAAEAGLRKGESKPFFLISGKAMADSKQLAEDYGLGACFQ
jgi:hypothetical protein